MIRVVKPTTAPAVLTTRGKAACDALCREYDSAPGDYRRGRKAFREEDFDRDIFAADEVKAALRAAQHDKCAFCESRLSHVTFGDVEHYRPKAAYKQRRTDPLKRPGYYWLAYEWANLFFSCTLCNQRFKKNHFLLRNGSRRQRNHRSQSAGEEPLLLDPSADPESHLEFRGHVAHPVGSSREGATTIDILGLNRAELVRQREEGLNRLKLLVRLRDRLRLDVATTPTTEDVVLLRDIEQALADSRNDAGEYAAMARAYLASVP